MPALFHEILKLVAQRIDLDGEADVESLLLAQVDQAIGPLAARAQQGDRVRRIGVLMAGVATERSFQSYLTAFSEGLWQSGWIEGQNLRLDVRWNAGDADLARTYAAQLIGLMPDVILADATLNLTIVRQATSALPVEGSATWVLSP